jgi:hypothetical protein
LRHWSSGWLQEKAIHHRGHSAAEPQFKIQDLKFKSMQQERLPAKTLARREEIRE